MLRVYVCTNDQCQHYQRERRVALILLGQHLYLDSPVVCACGQPAESR